MLTYIKNLPLDSSFYAEVRGGQQFRGWDEPRYMQATTINVLRLLLHVFIMAHTDPQKAKKRKAPEPYPTPDKPKLRQSERPGSFAFIARQHAIATS